MSKRAVNTPGPRCGFLPRNIEADSIVGTRVLLPGLEPARLDGRKGGELDGVESNLRSMLAFSADSDDRHLVGEVEAVQGYFLAHDLDAGEPSEHGVDAGEPGGRFLVFTIGVGQGQLDAGVDRLALLHFREEVFHVRLSNRDDRRLTARATRLAAAAGHDRVASDGEAARRDLWHDR